MSTTHSYPPTAFGKLRLCFGNINGQASTNHNPLTFNSYINRFTSSCSLPATRRFSMKTFFSKTITTILCLDCRTFSTKSYILLLVTMTNLMFNRLRTIRYKHPMSWNSIIENYAVSRLSLPSRRLLCPHLCKLLSRTSLGRPTI